MKFRYAVALYLLCWVWLLCGCTRNPPALRGGTATAHLGGISAHLGSQVNLAQPENPAATSAQTVERTETQQTTAPAPIAQRVTETPDVSKNGYVTRVTETFAPPPVLTHTVVEKTGTTLGAAHRDDSRTVAAKLASFRPVQLMGVGILLAAAAMFHPVVRKLAGAGKEFQLAAAGIGAAFVFGPAVVVGNEKLLLVVGLASLVFAWLLSRLGYKSGALDALK